MTDNRDNRASVPYLPKRDAGYRSANDEDDPYRRGKRPRDDCDATCKDPTANIKPSPSLKNCQMKPPDQNHACA